ncbi:MAG: cytochrome C oxidase subunit II [Acidimicrobiales bacterium]|nr:cytochrome C oxidase subunit II [Acidimicrobiales bacterium]
MISTDSDPTNPGEDGRTHHLDVYERRWMIASVALLVVFAASVAVAGFGLGFQVPGHESRVDPNTVADSPPWNNPGLRDLGNGEYEVYVIGRQYLFEPNEIRVPVGATVTFYVTSVDVQHGFKLQDTNINMQIVPGHISKLTRTFEKAGEFPYICNEYCGLGHASMAGSLIVEAQGG